MGWRKVEGQGVRNLHPFRIFPRPDWNWLIGRNGAGKTAFLETLSLLSTGRSFRTDQIDKVITRERSDCVVTGCTVNGVHLGLQRIRGGRFLVSYNGDKDSTLKYLLEAPAFKIISPDVISVIDGGSEMRRRALLWLMFHVEHSTRVLVQQYRKLLAHRNKLLKRRPIDRVYLSAFDKTFSRAGVAYADTIQKYFELVVSRFKWIIQTLKEERRMSIPDYLTDVSFSLRCGWNQSKNFDECIEDQRESDLERGYTQSGPHRFDVRVLIKDRTKIPAIDILSRGQLKLLALLWQLATITDQLMEKRSVVLGLDDIFAELDKESADIALSAVSIVQAQKFITALPESWCTLDPQFHSKGAVFHVEHGRISERKV